MCNTHVVRVRVRVLVTIVCSMVGRSMTLIRLFFFSNFITDNPLSQHLPTGKYKTLKHLPDGSYAQEAMKGVGMHVKINGPDDSVIMAKDYEVRSYLVYF